MRKKNGAQRVLNSFCHTQQTTMIIVMMKTIIMRERERERERALLGTYDGDDI